MQEPFIIFVSLVVNSILYIRTTYNDPEWCVLTYSRRNASKSLPREVLYSFLPLFIVLSSGVLVILVSSKIFSQLLSLIVDASS